MDHFLVTGIHEAAGRTILHPIGLTLLVVLAVSLQFIPRRYVVVPMFIMACFLSYRQRIAIAGADFTMLRLMVLFAWIRVLHKGEYRHFERHVTDVLILAYALTGTVAYTICWGGVGDLIYKLGANFDALGMYFLFRCVFRSWDDLWTACRTIAVMSVPIAIAFAIEWTTQRNMFAVFGGVPEMTRVREGRLRCQGAFSHPILAGVFWAALMPLVAALWWSKKPADRRLAVIGVFCCTVMVAASASSTPIFGWLVTFLGAGFFLVRTRMRLVRWGIVVTLVVLHLVMNKPVWHLIARVGVVGGSTGYHRFQLIDGAIRHFDEWWLIGTVSTSHWGHHLFDVTNQFILEGVRGGFVTMMLFIGVIGFSYRRVGLAWRAAWGDPARVALVWALGTSLFSHCVSMFAASYFGQIIFAQYLTIGMINCLPVVRAKAPSRRRAAKPAEPDSPALAESVKAPPAGGIAAILKRRAL